MKRIATVFLGLVLVSIIFLLWAMFGDQHSFQTGLGSYQGLPPTASDITIYQDKNISGIFIADFKISEHDFVNYAKQQNWQLHPIQGEEVVFQANAFHEKQPNEKKEIVDGLYFSKRTDNGGGVTAAYDRKEEHGYIDRSSR